MNALITQLHTRFIEAANPEKAIGMKAYMKGRFEYYGLTATVRRDLTATWYIENKLQIITNIRALVLRLWEQEQREYQYTAMDIMAKNLRLFTLDDITFIQQLISTKSWWDTVDWLSSTLLGKVLSINKIEQYAICEKWIISDNIWLKRSVIIHQLKFKNRVDEELLFALIIAAKGTNEFFINKASGWALRSYSKMNPHAVSSFVSLHEDLSPLTKREALKYC